MRRQLLSRPFDAESQRKLAYMKAGEMQKERPDDSTWRSSIIPSDTGHLHAPSHHERAQFVPESGQDQHCPVTRAGDVCQGSGLSIRLLS